MMRAKNIYFSHQQAFCVFPETPTELIQAVADLRLQDNRPVIVLIGGAIDEQHADVTRRAIQTISRIAEDINATVICGGTEMGVMAEIGMMRAQNRYKFPLVGIAPESWVTWPDGPRSIKFLWWGRQRFQLESHHSHFILVPGNDFGDESPWIVDTATILSGEQNSVTVLINGGEVSRKDIDLSLEAGRQVIVLSQTGRLADELANKPYHHKLITIAPANVQSRIYEVIETALAINERIVLTKLLVNTA